ncbi:MAG TPA: 8-oxo-dGTP diphosphatase MutT [Bacillota bacterium]|nr:8-oxo-dGTP diphosphatase MutT [Bacillota bacterium]HRU42526.1 8-oxo-dGTP diphosphatase MutT [Candidatus Diapherotrites archaeon]HNT03392.1 8-oxo-dGTP diphosphatase MutT [Bacillota bacterium]HOS70703.1 8-oxo-dGTP diphosphatase MutT [Bacillota bacterium]HQE66616.1 8-oxo-dGTP diphosphatase MutT [Bacillota bacterium]
MYIVTAAAIIRDGKVLIAQRQQGSHMEYKWEFPGGKLEPDETPEECIIREIKEEMDIDIEVDDIYKVVKFKYEEKDILLLCYLCRIIKGDGKAIECNDFKWVTKDELPGFDFVPADLPIVEKLINDKRL